MDIYGMGASETLGIGWYYSLTFVIYEQSFRYLCICRGQWHGPVAIKKIPINPAVDLDAQLLAFKQEIATLKKTRHDNVVLFMGACMKPPELAIVTRYAKARSCD